MKNIVLDFNTALYKDGGEWCISVGKGQDKVVYKGNSIIGVVSKYVYEETNCYEGSAVEDLIPLVLSNLCEQIIKLNK